MVKGTPAGVALGGIITGQIPDPQEEFGRDDLTILLLGTDEDRAPGGRTVDREAARSDMIMVARLHFADKRITGITIPRDTLARVPGHGTNRINAYHSFGGPSLAKEAVEGLIGVKIDRVVVVNYRVFQQMVDLIDGIDINVEKRLRYSDERGGLFIDLEPGLQRLDGYHAMGYVRYRRDSDFNRQERQRNFLVAFKNQALENKTKIPILSTKVGELTGHAFSDRELVALGFFAKGVESSNIKLGMLPVLDASNYDLVVDTRKLYDTLVEFELVDE
jgi:LCP family protein required for cell wall assembly